MIVDERRVDVVDNVLAVALLGNEGRRSWARAVIVALDGYDADRHVHDQRGNIGWEDETDV